MTTGEAPLASLSPSAGAGSAPAACPPGRGPAGLGPDLARHRADGQLRLGLGDLRPAAPRPIDIGFARALCVRITHVGEPDYELAIAGTTCDPATSQERRINALP
jgi:hypothetical protein